MDIDAIYTGLAFFFLGMLCMRLACAGFGLEPRTGDRWRRFKEWITTEPSPKEESWVPSSIGKSLKKRYGDKKRGYKIMSESEADDL